MIIPATRNLLKVTVSQGDVVDNQIQEGLLGGIDSYRDSSIYEKFLESDKLYVGFVKKIESYIRSSNEMRNYMSYLKTDVGMDKCYFLQGVHKDEARIELHHYPLTLFDITDIVVQKYYRTQQKFSTMQLANEIVQLHYEGLIGLVPVSETVHELAHAGEIFIPLQWIHGDIKEFIRRYNIGMTSDHMKMLEVLLNMSKDADKIMNKNKYLLDIKRVDWQLINKDKESINIPPAPLQLK